MQNIDHILQIIQPELHFAYIRASGPGGQNVNKVATAVQLRFNVRDSSLSERLKARLLKVAAHRISKDGNLIIEAKRFRTQEQNRQDVINRFILLLGKASEEPKHRKRTKPTESSKVERLRTKKHKSEIKKNRQSRSFD
ncbi:MAG TPA: alternative ribosome rescue aminoacyl-tRNA hydrolase ArfB [Anaerolineales bacterium]